MLMIPRHREQAMHRYRCLWASLAIIVCVGWGAAAPFAVAAQTACPSVTIRNDSSAPLPEDEICAAAEPWVEQGIQVYVFVTDEETSSEDDWFSIRDDVESAWGIYNVADQTFARTALGIEVTTDTSRAWGQDIAFGEALFGTPLDDDAILARLEGQLKNNLADGDVGAAIVEALTTSYATAYPAGTINPTVAPTTPGGGSTEGDTGASSGGDTATGESADASGSGVLGWFGGIVAAMIAGVAGLVALPTLIMPAVRRRRERQQLEARLDDLAQRIGTLLYAARTLFTGETAEETTLWKLFLVYGGDRYPDLAADVRGWTQQSMRALGEVLQLHGEMDQRVPGKQNSDVEDMIRAYEIMYLTLVGTNPAILQMNEDEFRTFIDPMAGGVEPPAQDSALVAQVRDLRRQLGEQPLHATVSLVDPGTLDADGVFGYANRIKAAINDLIVAQEHAPAKLVAATEARSAAANDAVLPTGLDVATAFGGVDALLRAAEQERDEQNWLYVRSHAEAADHLLKRIVAALPAVYDAVEAHHERERQVRAIAAEGYRVPDLDAAFQQGAALVDAVYDHLRAGEIEEVTPALDALTARSEAMLAAARQRAELHKQNAADLERLAREAARIEKERMDDVEPALAALRAYPEDNWHDLAATADEAAAALRRVFDDPANASDLASAIARHNSMEAQAFDEAAEELASAFKAIDIAEQQGKAIVARLDFVRDVERTADDAVRETSAALRRATERRDRDDAKIDAAVDAQIADADAALAEGKHALDDRRFVAASAALNRSRALSAAALASADEQARAIDALWTQLVAQRDGAVSIVSAVIAELDALVASARQPDTPRLVASAQAALVEAQRSEAMLSGKEDQALAQALQTVIAAYGMAIAAAEQARQSIRADTQRYQQAIAAAQKAIADAQQAISLAENYVGLPDAGMSGASSYRQSRELLPTMLRYGAPYDAYLQLVARALRAQQLSEAARREAEMRIRQVEQERAAERRRREEAERRRRAEEEARRRAYEAQRRASERSRSSSSWGSSSRSSSRSRSSSFGSSSRSRSSSMGSSRRR